MNQFKNVDFIIVGQGLAGTLLAHFLQEMGKSVFVIDEDRNRTSSKVAAGLVNPVTGMRLVKTWKIDELFPFAKTSYQELEKILGIKFYSDFNLLRVLKNPGQENQWLARSADPAYQKYFVDPSVMKNFEGKIKDFSSIGEVRSASQVHLEDLLTSYKNLLVKKNKFVTEKFDYQQVKLNNEKSNSDELIVKYKNISAKTIVFCEGFHATENPYFNYLPFLPAKGEALIVKIPGASFDKIFKYDVFIVPLKKDYYWIGASKTWDFIDDNPTEKNKKWLMDGLNKILTIPYEIIEHRSAIRPTVKDRRPFLGLHPKYPQLAIFNGLGTKGASLAPYFANQMAEFLIKGKPVEKEVDIKRFE